MNRVSFCAALNWIIVNMFCPLLVPKEWDNCPLQFSQSIGDEQLFFQVFVIHWTLVARLSACEVS